VRSFLKHCLNEAAVGTVTVDDGNAEEKLEARLEEQGYRRNATGRASVPSATISASGLAIRTGRRSRNVTNCRPARSPERTTVRGSSG